MSSRTKAGPAKGPANGTRRKGTLKAVLAKLKKAEREHLLFRNLNVPATSGKVYVYTFPDGSTETIQYDAVRKFLKSQRQRWNGLEHAKDGVLGGAPRKGPSNDEIVQRYNKLLTRTLNVKRARMQLANALKTQFKASMKSARSWRDEALGGLEKGK